MSHHAYCYIGLSFAKDELKEVLLHTGADTHVHTTDSFGINEARQLSEQAHRKPVAAPVQTFVLLTETITHEAQNALLKLFEEPPPQTQFYLAIPKRGLLLPTLSSRLQFVETTETEQSDSAVFKKFLDSSLADRLTHIAEITKAKNLAEIEALVGGAEVHATQTKNEVLLRTVVFIRQYLKMRGASNKMLLEQLALAVS